MLTSGTAPPPGVKLSWAAMTAPVEVPVVVAANRPEAPGPKRTSLPSIVAAAGGLGRHGLVGAEASSSGLPPVSKPWAIEGGAAHRMNMAPKTAQPCLRSLASFPNV